MEAVDRHGVIGLEEVDDGRRGAGARVGAGIWAAPSHQCDLRGAWLLAGEERVGQRPGVVNRRALTGCNDLAGDLVPSRLLGLNAKVALRRLVLCRSTLLDEVDDSGVLQRRAVGGESAHRRYRRHDFDDEARPCPDIALAGARADVAYQLVLVLVGVHSEGHGRIVGGDVPAVPQQPTRQSERR